MMQHAEMLPSKQEANRKFILLQQHNFIIAQLGSFILKLVMRSWQEIVVARTEAVLVIRHWTTRKTACLEGIKES